MRIRRSKMKTALVLVLCASMLLAVAVPAFASQKITNPGNSGAIDGIAEDPDTGIHNSYAWCTEMFAQEDADYLWVGTNRDLGQVLLGAVGGSSGGALAAIADRIGANVGLPAASPDKMGKIYRQRAADNDARWELMYENPAISGYRRMILFKGDLYVCAGLTNAPEYDYSLVLRFTPEFQAGDEPEIVLWETLPRDPKTGNLTAREYFRAACVFEDKLYIGTFDSKIYVTDGTGLANLTPNKGAKDTGWELFADLRQHPDLPSGNTSYVWDIIGFKGSIYVFVTYAGFNVFKLTPRESGGPEIMQIVGGSAGAKYPNGIGIEGLVAASPFLATFDKDYVYVSTFANGPLLLVNFCTGQMDNALNSLYCPPSVFRFDEGDNWEVVAGDTAGKFVAKDKAGNPLPVVGNQRAGFFTGTSRKANTSFNQYVWWLAEYEGKLYASTWDMGVFKQQAIRMVLLTLLVKLLGNTSGRLGSGTGLDLQTGLQALSKIPGAMAGLLSTIPTFISAIKYLEKSNPDGFDLFVSEDGKNFSPVTVNGFGNAENYGGRVLLPTEYGLFVCTANPFGGAQVWRLDDIKQELQPNIPAVIHLGVGETRKASLRGLALPRGAAVQVDGASGYVRLALEKRSESTIIDRVSNITNLLGQYIEVPKYKKHPTQMYDVVFTGEAAGEQDVTLRFYWNGVEATKTLKVIVTDAAPSATPEP